MYRIGNRLGKNLLVRIREEVGEGDIRVGLCYADHTIQVRKWTTLFIKKKNKIFKQLKEVCGL